MKRRFQAGSELIEFALVLPLLLLLIFGIIDFGIAMYDLSVLTNAGREGARAGIALRMPRLTDDEIRSVVNAYCADHLITFGGSGAVSIDVQPPPPRDTGQDLTVTVSYQYQYAVISSLIPVVQDPTFRKTTIMRME